MPRLVLLFHELLAPTTAAPKKEARSSHWDLMLEDEGELLTWACEQDPRTGKVVAARKLSNHRLEYLEYEGPISQDRGSVSRVLQANYEWVQRADDLIIAQTDCEFPKIRIERGGDSAVDSGLFQIEFSLRDDV